MLALTWIRGLVAHRSARLGADSAGVAVAVALLASLGMFLTSSKATMTQRSIATVAVDWQIEAQAGAKPVTILSAVKANPSVTKALPVAFGSTRGFEARPGKSLQQTGAGVVLGLPPTYRSTFPGELRQLVGSTDGVLVAQQTAANLQVGIGDALSFRRGPLGSVRLQVTGIIDLPQANSLFQKVGAPVGAQPQAPPDNVVVMDLDRWHRLFDPLASKGLGSQHYQIHARIDHSLPPDPGAAFSAVTGEALNLEAKLSGGGLVGNNIGATLDAARSDALYAQVMFVFLGLPGAVLAGLLTTTITLSSRERRLHEQALLRIRGASVTQAVRLAILETAVVAALGGFLGLASSAILSRAALGSAALGASLGSEIVPGTWALLAGIVVATLAIARPAVAAARHEAVNQAGQSSLRSGGPRWQKLYLDAVLLTLSAVVFWATGNNGYQLVLAPEGAPRISVSYWAFAAPLFLWLGMGLLIARLVTAGLRRGRSVLARLARPLAGELSDTVAASMGRQRGLLSRAVVLVALTVAFAMSTAVFNSTYRQQAYVDALLTNGADVAVTESPGVNVGPGETARLAQVAGVSSVEPLQHRFAYVGADLQDLYGVRPASIVKATELQDAYFVGGTAQQLMDKLAASPDAVLVSDETVKDFQLRPGDSLRLRLRTGTDSTLVSVPFHYAGIVREFPTAPSDSFLVANADYIAKRTGSDAVGTFLVNTDTASPRTVATALRTRLGSSAQVSDIGSSQRLVGSSLTAVDLSGLTKIELGFALVLAATATGLVLALGLAERRRTFAIATALGAKSKQLGGFIWSEAVFVGVGGISMGILSGYLLSYMLVKILTGVFDPPPSSLSFPWVYLAAVGGIAVVAVFAAGLAAIGRMRVPNMEVLREAG